MKKLLTFLVGIASVLTVSAQTSTTLYEDANSEMLSWSTLCTVPASQVADIKAGDQIVVTVNARAEGNEWPKFGFEFAEGGDNYPDVFEMWGDKTFPYTATFTVTAADAEKLAGGFDIKGDGVQITKVVLVSNEPVETPEGETVLYNNPDSSMLSWSTLCTVPASQVADIKAGDQIVVTVNARAEGNEWPKFGFEFAEGGDNYPDVFEMWGDKTFPYTATFTVTAADAEKLAGGFDIKGDGVQITKVVLVSGNGEAEPDDALWSGDPTLLNWSDGPTVSAQKAAAIKVGDNIAITITNIVTDDDNTWPKLYCRDSDYETIFDIEFNKDEYADAEYPVVKEVPVTSAMIDALHGGFHFVGEGVYINRVALVADPGISTVVENLEVNAETVNVYNLNGVCVRHNVEAASATNDLPAGIYIVGGKKVLVK